MTPVEVLKKVRRIQIVTGALVHDLFAGQYHSAFKGLGMEFEEVREYQPGDDVRSIDWNVTARMGRPFVKRFREERELTVLLAVDVSPSQDFGTRSQFKSALVAELGATLAFSAVQNNDKVGLLQFTDRVERYAPAAKGTRHALRIVRELLYHKPAGRQTDVAAALQYLASVLNRRAVVFLVSDFQASGFSRELSIAAQRHDLIPVVVGDEREVTLPPAGYIELYDPETGEQVLANAGSRAFRERFTQRVQERRAAVRRDFRKLGIDTIEVMTGEPFVEPLKAFFRKRGKRR